MSRDWRVYLDDMLECASHVLEYTAGMTFEQFLADRRTYDAVLRNLEIMGEAAKQVPSDVRLRFPEIPWREVARFRDRLAHGYRSLDDEIVWDVVQHRIPDLQVRIRHALTNHGDAT